MTQRLRRRQGTGDLHFITCSCYKRLPLLGTARSRDRFVQILAEVRAEYGFALVGQVVRPEHIHLLISEPPKGTPATVMQVLKQKASRARRRRQRQHVPKSPLCLGEEEPVVPRSFWQRRFYDFNVWSLKKKVEKIAYMHRNPVPRGLVIHPKDWRWSSYAGYERRAEALIAIDFSD